MKRCIAAIMLVLALCTAARASDQLYYGPFGRPNQAHHEFVTSNEWRLVPEQEGSKMNGKVKISCFEDDRDELRLEAHNLPSKGVFTIWLTSSLKDTAERGGVGNKPYMVKSSNNGSITYGAYLSTCPLQDWKYVEVRYHKDGDPKNVDGSERILASRLKGQ